MREEDDDGQTFFLSGEVERRKRSRGGMERSRREVERSDGEVETRGRSVPLPLRPPPHHRRK
ncbi:MAG: hypothetical protein WC483_01025 [Candidatus Paceibacterota bacterium]